MTSNWGPHVPVLQNAGVAKSITVAFCDSRDSFRDILYKGICGLGADVILETVSIELLVFVSTIGAFEPIGGVLDSLGTVIVVEILWYSSL